jgi:prolyl-tRNA synthetase
VNRHEREGESFGSRLFHWERLGVPTLIELGPRDLASGTVVLRRRDLGPKETASQDELPRRVPSLLTETQRNLFIRVKQRLAAGTVVANPVAEVQSLLHDASAEGAGGKFIVAHLKE